LSRSTATTTIQSTVRRRRYMYIPIPQSVSKPVSYPYIAATANFYEARYERNCFRRTSFLNFFLPLLAIFSLAISMLWWDQIDSSFPDSLLRLLTNLPLDLGQFEVGAAVNLFLLLLRLEFFNSGLHHFNFQ
jgi:hypothetical protein